MRRLRFWRSIVHQSIDGVSILKKSSRLSSVDLAKRISAFMAGGLGQVRARLLAGPCVSGSNSSSPARRTEPIASEKLQASTDNVSRASRRSK
jgi:hypothetical protein